MSCSYGRVRLLVTLVFAIAIASNFTACSRLTPTDEQVQVTHAFDSWKNALINHQIDQALTYVSHHVNDYLTELNSNPVPSKTTPLPPPSPSPGVDLLLRTALQKKVPADLRAKLTLSALVKRITERNLFNPRDVHQIDLGHVSVEGSHASAEVYYQGTLTALRLPFVKEGDGWKIDVMALLPYAEVLMRVDRAVKGETEAQQVDQLVSKLPSL
jgi:hypothetical protein